MCLEVEENAAENCSNDKQENQEVLNEDENESEKAKGMAKEKTKRTVECREDQRVKEGIYRIRMTIAIRKEGAKRHVHLTTFQMK